MLKSLSVVVSLCLLVCLSSPLYSLPSQAVVALKGKSSGEFICKNELAVSNCLNVDGLSFSLSNDYDVKNLIKKLNAKPIHYFFDGEVENYYYFTEKLPKKELIVGKKVNLHVAIKKDFITVGSPIIYYGY